MEERGDTLLLKVKTMDNSILEVSLSSNSTVLALKREICKKLRIPIQGQRLIFQGKLLKNTDTLQDHRIGNEHVIHLVATVVQNEGPQEQPLQEQPAMPPVEYESSINQRGRRYHFQNSIRNYLSRLPLNQNESLEAIRQNILSIQNLMNSRAPLNCLGDFRNGSFLTPFNFSTTRLEVGQWVDAKDTIDQWLEGQVIQVNENNQVYIHYNGWGSRWDEWIDINSPRLSPFRTHSIQYPYSPYLSPFPNTKPDAEITTLPKVSQDPTDFIFQTSSLMERTKQMMDKLYELQTLYHHEKASQDIRNQKIGCVDFGGVIRKGKRTQKLKNSNSSVGRLGVDSVNDEAASQEDDSIQNRDVAISEPVSVTSSLGMAGGISERRELFQPNSQLLTTTLCGIEEEQEETKSQKGRTHSGPYDQRAERKIKEAEIKLIAAQLAPIIDRLGRLITDVSPHIYRIAYEDPVADASSLAGNAGSMVGRDDAQSTASVEVPRSIQDFTPSVDEESIKNGNMEAQSELNLERKNREESKEELKEELKIGGAEEEDFIHIDRQIPVISSPGDVLTVSNLLQRRFSRAGISNGGIASLGSLLEPNIQFHIHAILQPQQVAQINQESGQNGVAAEGVAGVQGGGGVSEAASQSVEEREEMKEEDEVEGGQTDKTFGKEEGEKIAAEMNELEELEQLKEEFEKKLEKVKTLE